MCLYSGDYTINHRYRSRHGNKYTNIVNIKSISVGWCLYVLSNTKQHFGPQFMKKLSNTEIRLKKRSF